MTQLGHLKPITSPTKPQCDINRQLPTDIIILFKIIYPLTNTNIPYNYLFNYAVFLHDSREKGSSNESLSKGEIINKSLLVKCLAPKKQTEYNLQRNDQFVLVVHQVETIVEAERK